ncbi:MAG: lytic transglycosylase domain-containing protein [Acidobacteriota bacterium]|nr:lytic transglycosylase domain-containing protein [Acidobacteriota bacterium]
MVRNLLCTLLAVSLLPLALPSAATAEVKVRIGEDGVPFIYNETSSQRSRRLAVRLLPVPDARLARAIERYATDHRLSQRLVQAVVQVESGYNPRALSHKGAQGLMQLMPETARELAVEDAFDPEENLRGGTLYLRRMLDRFGDLQLALAAYNAGPTAVQRHGGVPPYTETLNYVRRVLALYSGEDEAVQILGARPPGVPGPKIYVVEGEGNQLIFTTSPPGQKP